MGFIFKVIKFDHFRFTQRAELIYSITCTNKCNMLHFSVGMSRILIIKASFTS